MLAVDLVILLVFFGEIVTSILFDDLIDLVAVDLLSTFLFFGGASVLVFLLDAVFSFGSSFSFFYFFAIDLVIGFTLKSSTDLDLENLVFFIGPGFLVIFSFFVSSTFGPP